MTELKTLKDLQKDYEWKFDTYNALRQEAINWIKKIPEIPKHPNLTKTESKLYDGGAINMLEQFFNITSEDLKETEAKK